MLDDETRKNKKKMDPTFLLLFFFIKNGELGLGYGLKNKTFRVLFLGCFYFSQKRRTCVVYGHKQWNFGVANALILRILFYHGFSFILEKIVGKFILFFSVVFVSHRHSEIVFYSLKIDCFWNLNFIIETAIYR